MSDHLHTGIDHVLSVGIAAWLFLNFLRIAAAWLGQRSGFVGSLGQAIGGTV